MQTGRTGPTDINAFQVALQREPRETQETLSLAVCLRIINTQNIPGENQIDKLAHVVRSGLDTGTEDQKELATTVARLVTESEFFYHISKKDRDSFLSALPFVKTIWKRIQSFVAIFRNKFFAYGGLGQAQSSEEVQKSLSNLAGVALFNAVQHSTSPRRIRRTFAEAFRDTAQHTPGWKRFSAAFQEELTERASEYTAWWNKLHPGEAAATVRMTSKQQKQAEGAALLEEIQGFINDLQDKDLSRLAKTTRGCLEGIKDGISGAIEPLRQAVDAAQTEQALKRAVGDALAMLPSGFNLLLRGALSKEKFSEVSALIAEVRQFHDSLHAS